MPATTRTIQAPKGTRDFYPADMAQRRWVESTWRRVSVGHGFEEIDGPTFEHLELYTVKSGPGIVSELFSFRRAGGDTDYALRPEFTPTLARMYAARANAMPKPTRWFSVCSFFRAERPQRGRLREHIQWNADVIGDESAAADAEVLAAAVNVLETLGLAPGQVTVKLNHRGHLETVLPRFGFAPQRITEAIALVDAVQKLPADEFKRRAAELGFEDRRWDEFQRMLAASTPAAAGCPVKELEPLHEELRRCDLLAWFTYAPALARGLAYYTGAVFEVHECAGRERAIAGGGRYDNLVELFGGPPTPAVGIAMGDVVIRLVLEERGLLPPPEKLMPRPDAFLVMAGGEAAAERFRPLLATLRRAGLHARGARPGRGVGKALGEASKARARFAVILGEELDRGIVVVKDLDGGGQDEVRLGALEEYIRHGRGRDGEETP
jgi:histidyl-tRNA synthetase